MGTRRKARESALQMLFAADVAKTLGSVLTSNYWSELSDSALDEPTREFADRLTIGTLREIETIDERIRTRAEHWRIERMAIVDRNVLRLAVYEFLFSDTLFLSAIITGTRQFLISSSKLLSICKTSSKS